MSFLTKLTVITFMITALLSVMPELTAQSEEQLARFEEERVEFFTRELELTDEESEKFWPLYNDFSNRHMKISEEERNTLRYFHSNYENMSVQETSETLNKYIDLKNQKHTLELEYHKKFREILTDKKVMMLYVVERQFRMHLIRRLRGTGQGPGGRHRDGRGPGGGLNPDMEYLPMPQYNP